jgi:O-acetyl-ADP-ribose deacetylase (regulator of RNase III)
VLYGNVRCPTGEARITGACGSLQAKAVIHAVGPVWPRSYAFAWPPQPAAKADAALEMARQAAREELVKAHQWSLWLAEKHMLKSVAFPAISCGVYGFPHEEAAPLALRSLVESSGPFDMLSVFIHPMDAKELPLWKAAARAAVASWNATHPPPPIQRLLLPAADAIAEGADDDEEVTKKQRTDVAVLSDGSFVEEVAEEDLPAWWAEGWAEELQVAREFSMGQMKVFRIDGEDGASD